MARRLVGACCDQPRKSAVRIDFYFVKGGPPDGEETYAEEIDESDSLVNSIPLPWCHGSTIVKNECHGDGYTQDGVTYCCQSCVEATHCICVAVESQILSLRGNTL